MNKYQKLGMAVVVLIVFLVGGWLGWWRILQRSIHFLTYRPRAGIYGWLNHDEMTSEELDQKLAECQAEQLKLREENENARRLLGTKVKPDTKFHLLKVIAFQPELVLLSNQENIDLEVDSFVVSGSFLVGKLSQVQGRINQARLLSHPEIHLPVKIWSANPLENGNSQVVSQGILKGRSEEPGNLLVGDVLLKDQVEINSWVGAVGSTGDIFLIGQVEEIFPSKDKVFETLTVNWAVEPKKLLTVGIVDH